MKKTLLLSVSLFLMAVCSAQYKRTNQIKPGNGDTTWHQIQPKRMHITNGNVLMKQEPGKFKLFATYKMGKVANWYAIDTKGNKIPVTYSAKGKSTCQVCAFLPNGMATCYEISCDDLPKPKTDAAKTAH
ncbi:MAG: hypothetical protein KF825_10615 [Ferruginibacter sp.]|nr:hypothetical protein [Ferruginibacter sp.]